MGDRPLLFALVACVCYLLAFSTSHAFVHWALPEKLRVGLGSQARNIALDGIRGYLAFSVYLHHCLLTWFFLPGGRWISPAHNFEYQLGATSVAIFFMITAFLFWGRAQARAGLEVKQFLISRLFRIYPLYLFVLFLICLGVAYKSNWTAVESARNIASEVVKWLFFRTPDINSYERTTLIVKGVTWTLLYEAWFYISLPLLVLVFLKRNRIWKKVIAVGIVALLFYFNRLNISIAATFLGGVVAVYWRMDKKRMDVARTHAAAGVAILCLGSVIMLMYKPFNPVGIALLTIFFAVIASGNTLFGFLEMRGALWLGEVSYSIYLCHGIILWVFMQNILPRLHFFHYTTKWFVASAIGITPIVVILSSASYLLIERPLINIGHRLSKRRVVLVKAKLEGTAADVVQAG